MSLAFEIFKQAECLKENRKNEKPSRPESWSGRQKIQDLYQRLLLMDLEYSLDKKVERDLWNVAFKNIIDALQARSKDKNPARRAEQHATLALFLESASGFYFQLMHDVCGAFRLDVPFRRKSSHFGVLNEPSPVAFDIQTPKRSSCYYLLQHILVHLGDIARYKKNLKQAEIFYKHAADLIPTNGQPFNQLALLDVYKGNRLATVYHYVRSVAVMHPFPAAATNLEKYYEKLSKESIPSFKEKTGETFKLAYLTFISLIHLRENFPKAKECLAYLSTMMCTHGVLGKMSPEELGFIAGISAFTLHRTSGDDDDLDKEDGDHQLRDPPEGEELVAFDLILDFLITFASDIILEMTKRSEDAASHKFLVVLKRVLAMISQSHLILSGSWVKEKTQFWPHLATLLNSLQNFPSVQRCSWTQLELYRSSPLPEDSSMYGFVPLNRFLKVFNFADRKMSINHASDVGPEEATLIRCIHVLSIGRKIAESLGNMRLLALEETKSGKMRFESSVQVTEDHRFATRPRETRPPLRNQALGPRFAKARQNIALQSLLLNANSDGYEVSQTTPSLVQSEIPAEPLMPQPQPLPVNPRRNSPVLSVEPTPRSKMALFDQNEESSPTNSAPKTGVPVDTRGKKNEQLYRAGRNSIEKEREEFPALQSTTKSKATPTGSSFFSSSPSPASLSSALSSTVNKPQANYSLFSQNQPNWTTSNTPSNHPNPSIANPSMFTHPPLMNQPYSLSSAPHPPHPLMPRYPHPSVPGHSPTPDVSATEISSHPTPPPYTAAYSADSRWSFARPSFDGRGVRLQEPPFYSSTPIRQGTPNVGQEGVRGYPIPNVSPPPQQLQQPHNHLQMQHLQMRQMQQQQHRFQRPLGTMPPSFVPNQRSFGRFEPPFPPPPRSVMEPRQDFRTTSWGQSSEMGSDASSTGATALEKLIREQQRRINEKDVD